MRRYQAAVLGAMLALLTFFSTGCNKLKARNDLNEGVMAYKNAEFSHAVEYFQEAVNLDPTLLNARLYLATALTHQYVPDSQTPSNLQAGMRAVTAYESVLTADPKNTNALGSIGNLYYEMHQFDLAKQYQEKLMQIEPGNPVPYNWVGLIDWEVCYKQQMTLRHDLKLQTPKNPKRPDILPPLPDKARRQLDHDIGPMVEEGINSLQKAIQLKPNYTNAYTYLNLMYRVRSDLETTPEARMADIDKANSLYQQALKLMKASGGPSSG